MWEVSDELMHTYIHIGRVSYLIYVSMRHYVLTTSGDIVFNLLLGELYPRENEVVPEVIIRRGGWPGFEVFVWRRLTSCWILSAMSLEIQEWLHKSRSRINNLYLLTRPITCTPRVHPLTEWTIHCSRLCLPSRRRYSFTNLGGMEGWVGLRMVNSQHTLPVKVSPPVSPQMQVCPHRRRSGWTSGGTHSERRKWVRVAWDGISGEVSPLQPIKGSRGASWAPTAGSKAEPRPKTDFGVFWRPQNAHFCTYMTKSGGGDNLH